MVVVVVVVVVVVAFHLRELRCNKMFHSLSVNVYAFCVFIQIAAFKA